MRAIWWITPVFVLACSSKTITEERDVPDASAGSDGTDSGRVAPREPFRHRPVEVTCGTRPVDAGSVDVNVPSSGQCKTNDDCTAGYNGRCSTGRGPFEGCNYDRCFADSDCESGSVCVCGDPRSQGNECSPVGCRVDADCPGSWCSPTFGTCGRYRGIIGYACHTPEDECVDDSDCNGDDDRKYCWFSPTVAHWLCGMSYCAG